MPVGIVSVVYGARCEVLEDGASLPCLLRGRLKHEAARLVVGDRVEYQRIDDRTGVVERILERRNQLSRSGRERKRRRVEGGGQEQVVLANPDQVVFVAAARDPGIHFELMDRALALARGVPLPAAICINKMDLASAAEIRRLMQPYERMGIPVLYASAEEGDGLEALHDHLRGKLSFFWGGSGVGKSSLIRALTGAEVKVGHWRTDNPRGPHTTNVTRLYPLPDGGLIADTPGFDWLELDTLDTVPDRLATLLPEAVPFAARCRFPGCTHCGEAGCAVMEAVLVDRVDRGRYARFRAEEAEVRPAPRMPVELHSTGEELFFRSHEGASSLWNTFQLFYLFEPERPERADLLDTLGVPSEAGAPLWMIFQYRATPAAPGRSLLTAKVTATAGIEDLLEPGQEVILRERGTIKGIARVKEVRPAADTWKLRKELKGTAIYEGRAFWSDLKPPRGVTLPPIQAATVTLSGMIPFEPIPELALGAATRQGQTISIDFLEIGSSEDELAYQSKPSPSGTSRARSGTMGEPK